jgi:hypothetical protein
MTTVFYAGAFGRGAGNGGVSIGLEGLVLFCWIYIVCGMFNPATEECRIVYYTIVHVDANADSTGDVTPVNFML